MTRPQALKKARWMRRVYRLKICHIKPFCGDWAVEYRDTQGRRCLVQDHRCSNGGLDRHPGGGG